jgi:hypothetical protein
MEVRRWNVVDIFYMEGEEMKANELANSLAKQGYSRDDSEGFDSFVGSIQLISMVSIE